MQNKNRIIFWRHKHIIRLEGWKKYVFGFVLHVRVRVCVSVYILVATHFLMMLQNENDIKMSRERVRGVRSFAVQATQPKQRHIIWFILQYKVVL